jgi:mycobactin phenyloxazoline synthetase
MLSEADVRDIVAADLGVAPTTIGYNDNLVRFGLNSMMLMHLAGKWRRQGYDVQSSSLLLEPTVAAWAKVLADNVASRKRAAQARPLGASSDAVEFPLAPMQHAYWLGRRQDQRLGGVAAHLYVEFDGARIDVERMRRATSRLVRRHGMLRAQFLDSGSQRILPEPVVPVFHAIDLDAEDAASVDAELEQLRQTKSHQRMDVASGQVLDVTVTTLPQGAHRLHIDVDMLVADAQSYRRVLDDLAALYQADDDSLAPLGFTFRDYLAAKAQAAQDNSSDAQWWANKIPDLPDIPSLPTVPENERADPSRSIRLHHWFDAAAKARLYANAHSNGVTPVIALATAFSEVIGRWSTRQRFLLNLPLFDREPVHDDIDRIVGDFTNLVLVDVDVHGSESTVAQAKRLQRELHTCISHSAYDGLTVLRQLSRSRGGQLTPSVVFTSGLDLGELFSERVRDVFGDPVWILSQGPQVDLDAQAVELNGGLLVNWDIRRDALPAGVAEDMFAEFRRVLSRLSEPNADWAAPLDVELPKSQREMRTTANDTAVPLGARTLHGAFFELAGRHPDRVALQSRTSTVSYGQLADEALAIAHRLTEVGVRGGDTVAVAVPKGVRQIPAVLGVLAVGAAYLPVGADHPRARRDRILQHSNVSVVVTNDLNDLPDTVTGISITDALAGPRLERAHGCDPDAVAYVVFTSGSTGEPKGVEMTHRAAANTIDALGERFGLDANDRTIGLSTLSFDLSVYDIFAPLSIGGTLACVDAADERDPDAWADLIANAGVTVLNCAPGLITMLADTATPAQLSTLRLVLTGGDRVKTKLAQRFRSAIPDLRFIGLGGTTETAIHSTVCEVTDDFPAEWTNVPYGTPLTNVVLRVVNERRQDCPDWVPGELWIGGVGVAAGYRNDPDQTTDRFVEVDGVRWYRTGDLARYLPGGVVDFLGRVDHQVKIRGYRVELGEVESALATLPEVDEAVALVTTGGRLAAAVHARGCVNAAGIADGLRDLLPSYMIPELIEVLADLPLTSNGKLDRAAIRCSLATSDSLAANTYVPPADAVEAAIEFIVGQVLGVDNVGAETDFFDAGGDSILATTLTAQIRGLLAVLGFGVSAVMERRTTRRMAEFLRTTEDPRRLQRTCEILLELAGIRVPESITV